MDNSENTALDSISGMTIKELKSTEQILELEMSISGEALMAEINGSIEQLAKTYKMPGFRDGNVPVNMVAKKEWHSVMIRTVERKVDQCVRDLVVSRNIDVAATPEVDLISFDEKDGLLFNVKFELMPPVPEIKLIDINIPIVEIKVTSKDINGEYTKILEEVKKYEPAEIGAAADFGDAVTIDFFGQMDGSDFPGNSGDNVRLVIGSNRFLEQFERQLIGCKVGDSKEISINYPSDHHAKRLAGKTVVFKITVSAVEKVTDFEEIGDELAIEMGLESAEYLKNLVELRVNSQMQELSLSRNRKTLVDELEAKYNFQLPQGVVERELKSLLEEISGNSSYNKEKFPEISDEEISNKYRTLAESRVRLGIIFTAYAKNNGINLSESEIEAGANSYCMRFGLKPSQINQDQKRLIFSDLLEKKIVSSMLEGVVATKLELSSQEFKQKYEMIEEQSER